MEEENAKVRNSLSHQILQTIVREHTQILFLSYSLFYFTCAQ